MASPQVPLGFTPATEACQIAMNMSKINSLTTFRAGDKCDATEVNNFLKHYGYMSISEASPSGEVGEGTSAALKAFQEFHQLKVDGIFGPQTRTAMTQDRCGFPDMVHSVDFTVVGPWKDRNIRYCFGTQSTQLDPNVCKAAIRRAIKTWADAGVGLTFTEVAANDNPEVYIDFRPANDPDHSMVGGVLAHADFPPGYSIVSKTLPLPTHFDDTEHKWVDGAATNAFDIETVALHELGHVLGLAHSSVLGTVMYPSVSPNFVKRTLTPDDLSGLRNLYPAWRSLGGVYNGKQQFHSFSLDQ